VTQECLFLILEFDGDESCIAEHDRVDATAKPRDFEFETEPARYPHKGRLQDCDLSLPCITLSL